MNKHTQPRRCRAFPVPALPRSVHIPAFEAARRLLLLLALLVVLLLLLVVRLLLVVVVHVARVGVAVRVRHGVRADGVGQHAVGVAHGLVVVQAVGLALGLQLLHPVALLQGEEAGGQVVRGLVGVGLTGGGEEDARVGGEGRGGVGPLGDRAHEGRVGLGLRTAGAWGEGREEGGRVQAGGGGQGRDGGAEGRGGRRAGGERRRESCEWWPEADEAAAWLR